MRISKISVTYTTEDGVTHTEDFLTPEKTNARIYKDGVLVSEWVNRGKVKPIAGYPGVRITKEMARDLAATVPPPDMSRGGYCSVNEMRAIENLPPISAPEDSFVAFDAVTKAQAVESRVHDVRMKLLQAVDQGKLHRRIKRWFTHVWIWMTIPAYGPVDDAQRERDDFWRYGAR